MANIQTEPPVPTVPFKSCPIAASLGVLGRKWSLLIIRDIGWKRADRFNGLLRSIPGLTPRMLAMRLGELERAGMIQRFVEHRSPKLVRWSLTEKGQDIMPVLIRLVAFGSRWFPERVFDDRQPRTLAELYPTNVDDHPWFVGGSD
jgi:DNA-binding HxlR family transcriptional regulator